MVKLALNDSYEKTVIPAKIRAYSDLTKPASSIGVTLAVPFSTILFGQLYYGNGVEFLISHFTTVVYASVTILLLHGASQSMNMAEDAHIDAQTPHKQNRPIPAGIVSKEEARTLAWLFIMAGVARAFMINTSFGIFGVLLALNGIFYNLNPVRAKEKLWINIIWQACSRGLLLYPATFAIWGKPLSPVAWSLGAVTFLLVMSMQQTADFADAEIDGMYDIITPAVYYDFKHLVLIMTGIAVLMFGVLGLMIATHTLPGVWWTFILAIPIGYSMWRLWNNPKDVNETSGQSITWYLYYLCLASMYILPAIQLSLSK